MPRYSKLFVSAVLLFTIPSATLCPQGYSPQVTFQAQKTHYKEIHDTPSYDDIMRLLSDIESGEIEQKCTPEELEKITHFIAFLAKTGALPDGSEESLSLDDDIEELLYGDTPSDNYQYIIIPSIGNGQATRILCKSWMGKQWKHVTKFAKKHKKALIIGTVVVVATVAVVGIVAAASSAIAGAAGAATASTPDKKEPPSSAPTETAPTLKSALDTQTAAFKDAIVKEQFFQPINPTSQQQGLPWEESGRALGSLFAHDSLNYLNNQIPYHPRLAQEIQDLESKYSFPRPESNNPGHPEIDHKFSTDYTHLYGTLNQGADFHTLSHQIRGEKALAFGCYDQAIQDLGKAIEINPSNPTPYLERGIAHFNLGQYDHSLADYQQFTSQTNPVSVSAFSLGFAKGLPQGVYESGEGLFLFMTDFIKHPIHTSSQVIEAFTTLATLVRNDEWGMISETLSPEIYQLATQWDALPSDKRGELAGYALGKHGADILVPGALAKVAAKSIKGSQELASVCKNLQIAQETLVLETAAEIGSSAKIAEVLEAGQKTARLADELGLTAHEMGQLKQAGQLETTVAKQYEHLSLPMQDSIALYKKAQNALKPYAKKPMPEFKVRELIHETGVPTFPRPKGVPENFLVMIADRGAGMEYVHPTNTHIRVRVMPGKPHSPNPSQQKPYVIQQKSGQAFDKHGKLIQPEKPESHIPLEEFTYRE